MKITKFHTGVALTSSLLLAALTGCGAANTASSSGSASSSTSVSASSNSAKKHTSFFVKDNGNGTKVIKDIDGKEVTVPTTPEHIADLWHANNQVVLLLGGAEKLVSTTTNVKSLAWFKQVYPGIEKVDAPVKGTDEAIERAEKYLAYLEKNENLIKERLQGVTESPKVLHIAGGSDLTKVDGSNSLIGEWMKLSGAKNSLDGVENLKNISLEQIIASQPEYIIIGGADAQKGVDAIKTDAAWADVPAVKNSKIIKNPVGTFNWDRYSAEEALQILWAAKLFHPEKFSDVDLVKETREFYSTFYGYNLTEDEAQRIINGQGPATN